MQITITWAVLAAVLGICQSQGCMRRDYGHGSVVCVCNSTYCDTYPSPPPTLPHQFTVITTSKDGDRLYTQIKNLTNQCSEGNGVYITLDHGETYQEIKGFGAAMTDSSVFNIQQLSPAVANHLMQSAWSDSGNGYVMARTNLGACDFSLEKYTGADEPSACTENAREDLQGFELNEADYSKITQLKEAYTVTKGKLTVLGSVWSPPQWMKESNLPVKGQLRKECYHTYAVYHRMYLDRYRQHGVNIGALTTSNEGFFAKTLGIADALPWKMIDLGNWITNYFSKAINTSEICIYAFDDQTIYVPVATSYSKNEFSGFTSTICGAAVHTYFHDVLPPSLLDAQKSLCPDKQIWSTETSCMPRFCGRDTNQTVLLGDWTMFIYYTEIIMNNLQHWVNAWFDWNLALDLGGGPNWVKNFVDSPIIVNRTADEFYKQPAFYGIAHFSKYIRPDSYRIKSIVSSYEPGNCTVSHVSFLSPKRDETVTVIHNKCPTAQNVCINGGGSTQTGSIAMKPYSTATVIMNIIPIEIR